MTSPRVVVKVIVIIHYHIFQIVINIVTIVVRITVIPNSHSEHIVCYQDMIIVMMIV